MRFLPLNRESQKRFKQFVIRCIPFFSVGLILFMVNDQMIKQDQRKQFSEEVNYKDTFLSPEIDKIGDSLTLWPDDPDCSKFKVNFGVNVDPTFLVSFPRSGNTWTRYLLECSTGIFTGSVYDDKTTYDLGFKGEFEPYKSGRVIAIKTHTHAFKNTPVVKLHGATFIILLIRNPADAITSYWSYKTGRDNHTQDFHHYNIDKSTFKGTEFRKFFQEYMEKWGQINESLLLWTQNLMVVFYENLAENPIQELRRILEFLEVKEDEARVACLQKHMKGPAKREHSQLEIDAFTHGEKKIIAHLLANTLNLLNKRGVKAPRSYSDLILPLQPMLSLNDSFT